jgi:hypothetical protein
LQHGELEQAEMAAREIGWLGLIDAFVVAYARAGSPKFEPAAVRWLARFAPERRELGLDEVQLAAAMLAWLRGQGYEKAEKTLLRGAGRCLLGPSCS